MNILILTTSYPDSAADSNGVFVRYLVRALVRRGHSLRVIVPARNDSVGATELDGVPVLRFRYALTRRGHVLTSLDGGIPEALKRSRRAVLHVPAMLACFGAEAVAHAGWADVIHANWLGAGIAGAAARLLTGTPMVMTLRGDDAYNIHAGGLWRAVGKCVFRNCAAVTAVSANMPPLVERYVPRRRRPVLVPTFGVDAEMFHPAEEHARRGTADTLPEQERRVPPSTGAKRRLWVPHGQGRRAPTSSAPLRSAPLEGATPASACGLFVGNILKAKGVDTLIAALGRCRGEWKRFRFVGDGPDMERMQSLARRLGIDGEVDWLGRRPIHEIPQLMRECDFFVLPSLSEGRPNVVLEAMATGLAVIATPVGGIPDIIADGENGLLIPVGDAEQLARAVTNLCREPDLRRRLGREARGYVLRENLTWDRTAGEFEAIFRKVAHA